MNKTKAKHGYKVVIMFSTQFSNLNLYSSTKILAKFILENNKKSEHNSRLKNKEFFLRGNR